VVGVPAEALLVQRGEDDMPDTRKKRLLPRVLAGGIVIAVLVGLTADADAAEPPPDPAPTLVLGNVRVQESDAGRHVAKIPITLSAPFDSDAWFTFETVADEKGATAGVDYRPVTKRKRIKAGVTATNVTVPIFGDTEPEGDEIVSFRISWLDAPPVAMVKSTGAIILVDDDTSPDPDGSDGPSVSASSIGVAEGDAGERKLQVVFGLSEPQSSDVLVTWTTVADVTIPGYDAANPGSDFKHVMMKTTRIKAGRTQKTALVTIRGDVDVEADEQLRVSIASVTGGDGVTPWSDESGLILIMDDDRDGDGDGLFDMAEVFLKTDPHDFDSDGDGLADGVEVRLYFTDPNNPDTDGDGAGDWLEVAHGSDPNDPNSRPRGF
jgi:hypothetical protein